MVDKYVVKTDCLKGFSLNDVAHRHNEFQFCKKDTPPGGRIIAKDTISRNPEWFRPINNYSDLFMEMIEKWDKGETVFTVEMGGLGPGYEQAIQVLVINTLRRLKEVVPTGDSDKDAEAVESAREEAINELYDDWGFSGAQVGAAGNLAFQIWSRGYYEVLKDPDIKDRLIQVSKHLVNKP